MKLYVKLDCSPSKEEESQRTGSFSTWCSWIRAAPSLWTYLRIHTTSLREKIARKAGIESHPPIFVFFASRPSVSFPLVIVTLLLVPTIRRRCFSYAALFDYNSTGHIPAPRM